MTGIPSNGVNVLTLIFFFLFSRSFKTANKYMAIIIHTQSITFQQSRVKNALFSGCGRPVDRPPIQQIRERGDAFRNESFVCSQTSKEINNSKRKQNGDSKNRNDEKPRGCQRKQRVM